MRPRVEGRLRFWRWIHGFENPGPAHHGQDVNDSIAVHILCFPVVLVANILQKILLKMAAHNLVHDLPLLGFLGNFIVEVGLLQQSK